MAPINLLVDDQFSLIARKILKGKHGRPEQDSNTSFKTSMGVKATSRTKKSMRKANTKTKGSQRHSSGHWEFGILMVEPSLLKYASNPKAFIIKEENFLFIYDNSGQTVKGTWLISFCTTVLSNWN